MTRTSLVMRDVLQFAAQGIIGGKRLVRRALRFLRSKIANRPLDGAEKQQFAPLERCRAERTCCSAAFRFVRRNMLGGDYLEFGVYRDTRSSWLMDSPSTWPNPYRVGCGPPNERP